VLGLGMQILGHPAKLKFVSAGATATLTPTNHYNTKARLAPTFFNIL